MSLTSKKNEPKSFEYFRSIYLSNLIYKSIAKIIANRVKVILSHVISEEKFGYLFNTKIHDVVGTIQQGIYKIKIEKK